MHSPSDTGSAEAPDKTEGKVTRRTPYDDLCGRDATGDLFPHAAVLEAIERHDRYMAEKRPEWSLIRATYSGHFWDWVDQHKDRYEGARRFASFDRVEVPKLEPKIGEYLAALYPRRIDPELSRTISTGFADPDLAKLILTEFYNDEYMRDRLISGASQALQYGCAGAKISYRPGPEDPRHRTHVRAFPAWQLLVDLEAHDLEDARYIGQIYYRTKAELLEEYPWLDLKGTGRVDFLTDGPVEHRRAKSQADESRAVPGEAAHENRAFVRVLELCNLQDSWTDGDVTLPGRLEIHILDERYNEAPVYMGALPLPAVNGKPYPHIFPLIMTSIAEHPYQGISYAWRLMHQIIEHNIFRSYQSIAARKVARAWVAKRGAFNPDQLQKLRRGDDGVVLFPEEEYEDQPLDSLIRPIAHHPQSPDVANAIAQSAADVEGVSTQSAGPLAFAKGVTATAVEAAVAHTESDYGRHAEQRDKWTARLGQAYLLALACAMRAPDADSDGASEDMEGLALLSALVASAENKDHGEHRPTRDDPKASRKILREEAEDRAAEAEDRAAEEEGENATPSEEEEGIIEAFDTATPAKRREGEEEDDEPEDRHETSRPSQAPSVPIVILDADENEVEVTADDIDGTFQIGFNETGRSPHSSQRIQQNLIQLGEQYMALWQIATSDDLVMAVMARAQMEALFAAFELPAVLDPDKLFADAEEQTKAPAQPSAEEQFLAGAMVDPGMAAPPPGAPPSPGAALGADLAPGATAVDPAMAANAAPVAPSPVPAPPPTTAPGAPEGALEPEMQALIAMLLELANLPPSQAVEQILLSPLGQVPDIVQICEELLSLPPDQQPAALQALIEMLVEELSGAPATPPPMAV